MTSLRSASCIIVSSLFVATMADQFIVDIYWITPRHFKENVQSKFVASLSSVATSHCINSTSCGNLNGKTLTALVVEVVQSETASSDSSVTVAVRNNSEYLAKSVIEEIILENRETLNTDTKMLINRVGDKQFHKSADRNNWIIVPVILVITLILLGVVVYLSKHKVDHMAEHLEMKADDGDDDDKAHTNL